MFSQVPNARFDFMAGALRTVDGHSRTVSCVDQADHSYQSPCPAPRAGTPADTKSKKLQNPRHQFAIRRSARHGGAPVARPQAQDNHLVSMPVSKGNRTLLSGLGKKRIFNDFEPPSMGPEPINQSDDRR